MPTKYHNPVTLVSFDANGLEVTDLSGNPAANTRLPDGLGTLLAGEDQDNNVIVVEQGQFGIEAVAASQTDQVLGATGAAGDYLEHLWVVVTTAATSQVLISNDGGTTDVEVVPNSYSGGDGSAFSVPVNASAGTGGWAVTTGAGVAVLAVGRFT